MPAICSKTASVHQKQPPEKKAICFPSTDARSTSVAGSGKDAAAACAGSMAREAAARISARLSMFVASRDEIERRRVHAIAQTGGARAVVEDVAQMAIAPRAEHLVANHAVGGVSGAGDILFGDGLPETRPAGAGLEFRFGVEQGRGAADASVDSIGMVRGVLSGEGPFGALSTGHFELLRRQLLPPFGVCFSDFLHFGDPHAASARVKLHDLDC